MRVYTEHCLRNLQDRMIVCGFEGWDVFIVLGVALVLQMVKVNGLAVWAIAGLLSAFLILIKKGKPPNNKGKKVSDETRKNMSISFSGNKNSFYGKTHSEEQKRQWSKARGFTFTEQQILAIKNDPRSNLLVSKDYDCGKSTISRIRNDNWKVPLKQ